MIEVTHGDGLGGSSFNYGFSKTPEQELIKIAAETAKRAKIAFLMLPGVGTKDDIRAAQDNGGQICRIATHCTEADVSIQHFGLARELGLETVGFLMMSHTQPPEVLAKQARIMVDAGCQCVYVVDSAGALIMEQTADRVSALVAEIGDEADVGFHGHENLGLGVANTVIAARAGATQIDGSVRRFGAGAGNTPLEAFIGVCDKLGWTTGVDFLQIVDASEDVIKPAMPEECQLDRMTLMMGYAGVYSSFLKHAGNAAERYGVSGAQDPARGRPPQADRRPGGPAHRHRADAEGRAGEGSRQQLTSSVRTGYPGTTADHVPRGENRQGFRGGSGGTRMGIGRQPGAVRDIAGCCSVGSRAGRRATTADRLHHPGQRARPLPGTGQVPVLVR